MLKIVVFGSITLGKILLRKILKSTQGPVFDLAIINPLSRGSAYSHTAFRVSD